MKLLHTSDWHLGHTLKDVSRDAEHRAFLRWLLGVLREEQANMLVITGDIFDTATPTAAAEALWYDFLAAARRQQPALEIIAIAGNHDSPARLAAPAPLLRDLNVHVFAAVPRDAHGRALWDELIYEPQNGMALVAAVPFLRPHDVLEPPEPTAQLDDAFGELIALTEAAHGPDAIAPTDVREPPPAASPTPEPTEPATDDAAPPLTDEAAPPLPQPIEPTEPSTSPLLESDAEPLRVDLATAEPVTDTAYSAVEAVFREIQNLALARRKPDQPLIVLGHLYVSGAAASLTSERPIVVGGQHAAPPRMFHRDASYIALGHLHRGQRVGPPHIRYAGSPLPLAMEEATYHHHVVVATFDGATVTDVRKVAVPRTAQLIRLPSHGAAPLAELTPLIEALPALGPEGATVRPLVEVHALLQAPVPHLRTKLEAAFDGKWPRLVSCKLHFAGDGKALTPTPAGRQLNDVSPEEVFVQLWHRTYGGAPREALRTMFRELTELALASQAKEEIVPEHALTAEQLDGIEL